MHVLNFVCQRFSTHTHNIANEKIKKFIQSNHYNMEIASMNPMETAEGAQARWQGHAEAQKYSFCILISINSTFSQKGSV